MDILTGKSYGRCRGTFVLPVKVWSEHPLRIFNKVLAFPTRCFADIIARHYCTQVPGLGAQFHGVAQKKKDGDGQMHVRACRDVTYVVKPAIAHGA